MKLRVMRDFGFDVADRHFNHGHEFDPATVVRPLPQGASDEQKKDHDAAIGQATTAIEAGKKKGYLEEIDSRAAAKPAEKEG